MGGVEEEEMEERERKIRPRRLDERCRMSVDSRLADTVQRSAVRDETERVYQSINQSGAVRYPFRKLSLLPHSTF